VRPAPDAAAKATGEIAKYLGRYPASRPPGQALLCPAYCRGGGGAGDLAERQLSQLYCGKLTVPVSGRQAPLHAADSGGNGRGFSFRGAFWQGIAEVPTGPDVIACEDLRAAFS
jgi:hypothetical protein